ncbi:hypothetical protein [Streptomyces sp. NPDC012888]|uniref:hypothetical protein n=1 Tax=Streptomyces sp. NPDC012888 TaxID=3364855 RepID=UPI00369731C0
MGTAVEIFLMIVFGVVVVGVGVLTDRQASRRRKRGSWSGGSSCGGGSGCGGGSSCGGGGGGD